MHRSRKTPYCGYRLLQPINLESPAMSEAATNEDPHDPEDPRDAEDRDKRTEDSDPVAGLILQMVAACATAKSVCPTEVARAFAEQRRTPKDPPDLWRRYMPGVRQQAKNLARQGRITILRKGKPVDPNVPVKGVIRLAPPQQGNTDPSGPESA